MNMRCHWPATGKSGANVGRHVVHARNFARGAFAGRIFELKRSAGVPPASEQARRLRYVYRAPPATQRCAPFAGAHLRVVGGWVLKWHGRLARGFVTAMGFSLDRL